MWSLRRGMLLLRKCERSGFSGVAPRTYAARFELPRFWRLIRCESSFLALSSSSRRVALKFFPARLIKNVSIRIPDPAPFGDTFFDANVRAMVGALLLNNPSGGWVESVVTLADHFFGFDLFGMCAPTAWEILRGGFRQYGHPADRQECRLPRLG